jgi:hypothetical protein
MSSHKISALNPALFLLSFSFCSLVNGTLPLNNYRHTHTANETAIGFGYEVFTFNEGTNLNK